MEAERVNTKKSNIIIFSGNGHLVVKPMQRKFLAKRLLKQSPQLNDYPRTLILQWSIWSVNETDTQQVSQSVIQSMSRSVTQSASINKSVGWSVNCKSAIQSDSESISNPCRIRHYVKSMQMLCHEAMYCKSHKRMGIILPGGR